MDLNDKSDDLDLEAKRLNVQKLRYELRDAALRWWQRPTWIAAIASITVAVSGLTWAIGANLFENRMRELRLETHDLKVKRDEQLRLFEADRRKLDAERRGYEARLVELQDAVKRLDVPVIGDVDVIGPWRFNRTKNDVYFHLNGTNFGNRSGQVEFFVQWAADGAVLASASGELRPSGLTTKIKSWTPNGIDIIVDGFSKEFMRGLLLRKASTGFRPAQLTPEFVFYVVRSDGRSSPTREVPLKETTAWLGFHR